MTTFFGAIFIISPHYGKLALGHDMVKHFILFNVLYCFRLRLHISIMATWWLCRLMHFIMLLCRCCQLLGMSCYFCCIHPTLLTLWTCSNMTGVAWIYSLGGVASSVPIMWSDTCSLACSSIQADSAADVQCQDEGWFCSGSLPTWPFSVQSCIIGCHLWASGYRPRSCYITDERLDKKGHVIYLPDFRRLFDMLTAMCCCEFLPGRTGESSPTWKWFPAHDILGYMFRIWSPACHVTGLLQS